MKTISQLWIKCLRWLDGQMMKARIAGYKDLMVIAPTSDIGPEAIVENIHGGREYIQVGEHSFLRGRLITYGHGGKITIGDWSYVGIRTEIWSMDSITIGNRVLIAHDVNIHDGTAHSKDLKDRHEHYRHVMERGHPISWEDMPGVSSAPIVIEDDVWISFGVTILKGVRIGKGSIIAANSIVTKNVPAGVIYRMDATPIIEEIN